MFLQLALALCIGSVAHGSSIGSYKLKAYDDICPLLSGVEWVTSPERPNEEGLWFPIAAMENPVLSPSKMKCPKQSYTRVNATYDYTQYYTGGKDSGCIELEDSEVGLVGEMNLGQNVFRMQCVDLDYSSWGVLYICGNEVGDNLDFEIFYVVSRHRQINDKDFKKAKDVIAKFGGDPSTLVNFDQSGCE